MKTILSGIQTWTKGKIKESITASTADWNQNDSNANNYVKNRTHWEEEENVSVLNETTVTITDEYYEFGTVPYGQLIAGQTYYVTLNGVEYKCVARYYDEYVLIGNGTIYGDGNASNNEPFCCDSYDDGNIYLNAAVGEYTISISDVKTVVHKLDHKYLPNNLATTDDVQDVANNKMDANNPVGTGSFSMNRKPDTTIGANSHAEGYEATASGDYSHAEGGHTTASGDCSHAEGSSTIAQSGGSHSEGILTVASGIASHAEGSGYSHIVKSIAYGDYSHLEGYSTVARTRSQHVQGEYNILDSEGTETTRGKYAHIVGNGSMNSKRSNAHTLDWNGVGWFQGGLQVGGNAQDDGAKNVLLEGDAVLVPENAAAGQTLVVKSVDENGKPIEWETKSFVQIPQYTAEDNGKFLNIVNGVLSWITVLNGEEGEY